jgi:adenosylhomocysteine nucleosidase
LFVAPLLTMPPARLVESKAQIIMLLRWIVSNLVQHAARQQMADLVAEATGQKSARRDEPGTGSRAGDEDAAPEVSPLCDIACLFAMGVESGGLADLLQESESGRYGSYTGHLGQLGGRRVLVADTGAGSVAAAQATWDIVARHQPAWIVSSGFAAGLTAEMRRGHVLMADSVTDLQGQRWEVGLKVDPAVLPRSVHVGGLLSVDQLLRNREQKCQLADTHAALACDMETAAIAEVCRRTRTRLLAVRIISDGLDDRLPAGIEKMMNQQSLASKLGAATAAIWSRPSTVKDLWQLKQQALETSDRLARFLVGVVEQLGDAADDDR